MKYVWAFVIMGLTALAYVGLMVFQPLINDLVNGLALISGDIAIAEANMVYESFPLWVWGIPGLVGGISILIVLRSGDQQRY